MKTKIKIIQEDKNNTRIILQMISWIFIMVCLYTGSGHFFMVPSWNIRFFMPKIELSTKFLPLNLPLENKTIIMKEDEFLESLLLLIL